MFRLVLISSKCRPRRSIPRYREVLQLPAKQFCLVEIFVFYNPKKWLRKYLGRLYPWSFVPGSADIVANLKYVNGVHKSWDLIKTHNSVVIIIFNISRKVLVCVKQFRPGVYINSIPPEKRGKQIDINEFPACLGVTLEFCAGIIDKDKSIEEIAQEEVLEECGYSIRLEDLQKIQTYRSAIGVSGEYQTLFYTEVTDDMKTSCGGGVAKDGEFIEVVELGFDEAKRYLNSDVSPVPSAFLYGLLWFFTQKANVHKCNI